MGLMGWCIGLYGAGSTHPANRLHRRPPLRITSKLKSRVSRYVLQQALRSVTASIKFTQLGQQLMEMMLQAASLHPSAAWSSGSTWVQPFCSAML